MPVPLYPAPVGLAQGSTGGPVAGTRASVPGGVESTFEFNRLLMNVRSWWDTYLITEIDGLDDADVRDAREQNPGFHGETAFDSYYGGRTITLGGTIRAYSLFKMRDMEQAMRQAFADLNEFPLIIRSGIPDLDVFIYCKKYQKLVIKEAQTDFRHSRQFQVALRASNPFFLSYTEQYAPITLDASPKLATVTNTGNYDASPRFRLIGPLTNPQIVNITTGKQMTVNGTIASGHTLDIDVRRRTVIDDLSANRFDMLDVTSDWVRLTPGQNGIQLSGTGFGTGSAMQIFWNHTSL